jgi:Flp pilus assembly pilin Flp
MNLLKSFCREDRGQDVVEYTLLMAAMALATAAMMINMKNAVNGIWVDTNKALTNAKT